MKFQDPVLWADQESELQADEISRTFLGFFLSWFTEAEKEFELFLCDKLPEQDRAAIVHQAVQSALNDAEHDRKIALSMEWIGQMLGMAVAQWKWGKELESGLTWMERRMLDQMAAIQLAALAESATL